MSPARRDADYLGDIAEAMRRIIAYTEGLTYAGFLEDAKTQDAVIRNLQVLGEAVKRLSPAMRRAHPALPWREMAALRDKLVHDYFGIRHTIIWAVARQELPMLLPQVEALLSQLSEGK
jgi:uncharacterized protein with HEPN domain